jgi:hypothetical protein
MKKSLSFLLALSFIVLSGISTVHSTAKKSLVSVNEIPVIVIKPPVKAQMV